MKALDTFLFEKLKINKDTISADAKKPLKYIDELIDYLGNKVNISDLYTFCGPRFKSNICAKLMIYFGLYDGQIDMNKLKHIAPKTISLESGSITTGDFYIVLKGYRTISLKTRLNGSNEFIKFAHELAELYLDNYDDLRDENKPENDLLKELVDAGYDKNKIKDILYDHYRKQQ